jgi:hypothetical protein
MSFRKNQQRDFKHEDWLLFSQQKLIESIDPNVSITYVDKPRGGRNLVISGINPNNIDDYEFITNTDQNNNYLYLEKFNVYVNSAFKPSEIPGLNDTMINLFRNSDMKSFLKENSKTHKPFTIENINDDSFIKMFDNYDKDSSGNIWVEGTMVYNATTQVYNIRFSKFIDAYTTLTPYVIKTSNSSNNRYELILNPDLNVSSGAAQYTSIK